MTNKESSLSRSQDSRPCAEADMITVNIDVSRCMKASQWFPENSFGLAEPERGVARGRATIGPMKTHSRGIDIPFNFHPDDAPAALLFKLAEGGK